MRALPTAVALLLLLAGPVAAALELELRDMPQEAVEAPGSFEASLVVWVDCLEGVNGYDIATAVLSPLPGHDGVVVAMPADVEFAWPACDVVPGQVEAANVTFQVHTLSRALPPAHEPLSFTVNGVLEPSTRRAEQTASTTAAWQSGLAFKAWLEAADNAGAVVDELSDVPLVVRSDSNGPIVAIITDGEHTERVDVAAMSRTELTWPFMPSSTKSRLELNVVFEDRAAPGVTLEERDQVIPVAIVGQGILSTPGPAAPVLLLGLALVAARSSTRKN